MKLFSTIAVCALALMAPSAWARTCAVTITGNDQMKFDQSGIKLAPDCTLVELTLKHSGKMDATVMGHNWVLTKSADFQAVANAGVRSTIADSYLPKADARVIAHTKVIGGGDSTTVSFPTSKLRKGGDYTFFCSFPGHWAMMKGTLSFG
ncbi:TPA: azurin [Xanthomonas vasicola pv. zeae]|uniref:Azurin n=1 Tax=Xanthomonas vasicola pv. vasculorum TaxID=325776 RepID=A0AAE8F4Z6_XANVA|nr:azurin [Xanthomonas vasicola]AVQ08154.1 azurin [Xanthomonas vasicola pv. vasculorum]AZM72351.1 azurin [Xanthomonas vasicola pv. vasculorum]KEZ97869.1 azurin [Xanthomonas vasicola pv. vasculorum NCPPB 895]KFA33892.1 azurin [Xanthomonas vasicola pv. vasculorum NCPPB 206]MBV7304116.1 azurin [Xanthomonas vasicola pv. vasculorum]